MAKNTFVKLTGRNLRQFHVIFLVRQNRKDKDI